MSWVTEDIAKNLTKVHPYREAWVDIEVDPLKDLLWKEWKTFPLNISTISATTEPEEEKVPAMAKTSNSNEDLKKKLFKKKEIDDINTLKTAAQNRALSLQEKLSIPVGTPMGNIILAGGFFASTYHNEDPRDIDFFILNSTPQLPEFRTILDKLDWYISKTANMLEVNTNYMNNNNIVRVAFDTVTRNQFIFTSYKTREELVDHFDFKHCQIAYDCTDERLYVTRKTFDLIKDKNLVQTRPQELINSTRLEKFLKRGWKLEQTVGV